MCVCVTESKYTTECVFAVMKEHQCSIDLLSEWGSWLTGRGDVLSLLQSDHKPSLTQLCFHFVVIYSLLADTQVPLVLCEHKDVSDSCVMCYIV